jgi:hypothetical protein
MTRSLIAAWLLLSVAAFASDLKFSRKNQDPSGIHGESIYYFQGQRIRIDHRAAFGYDWKNGRAETVAYGPRMATIFQCDMHRVLELDYDHHQYTVVELDRSGAPVNVKAAPAPRDSGAKVKVIVETRDTGETRQMFGHTARHFVTTRKTVPAAGSCASAQESVEDGWYIELDPRPTSCQEMEHPLPQKENVAVLTAGDCRDDYEIERSGPIPPPFAVELTVSTHTTGDARKQQFTNRITDLSNLPLDPQIFDLPTGYKHVDKLDNSPNLPWLLHARLLWQSAKSTVWGWTPWGR